MPRRRTGWPATGPTPRVTTGRSCPRTWRRRDGGGRQPCSRPGSPASTGPTAHGGQGLTPEHNAAWITECALAQVPPFLNMVGCVLTGSALLAVRHAGAAGGAPAADHHRRAHLVPAVQRTGRRVATWPACPPGPSATATTTWSTARRCGAPTVGWRDWGILMARTDPDAAAHRGHLVPAPGHVLARGRAPAPAPDERRGRVRRGLPDRCPGPGGQPPRPGARGVDGGHVRADQRTGLHRRLRRLAQATVGRRCWRWGATWTARAARRCPTCGSGAPRCGPWAGARARWPPCWGPWPSWGRPS